ncbi:MAG: 1-deoxy-D-xylulose-5-phosphate synthase N-terminal domain-containing protein, partial [Candidatus Limnocylindria bacterium]
NSLKAIFIPNILFEQFGFTYFGPVNGHDLDAVEGVLKKARDFRDGPVFVHVHTQKGHGYGPAEEDNQKWHGVSATGGAAATAPQYTKVFADAVAESMRREPMSVAITVLRPLPGIVLMAPKDEAELRQMVWTAVRYARNGGGPIAFRYPRGTGVGARLDEPLVELPIGVSETVRDGADVAILAYGTLT